MSPTQVSFGWSSLAFALAAPDLLNDTKFTGLRLTPIIGATFPTHPNAYVGGQVPITTVRVAGQLERRFGSLEVAYRATGSTTRCHPIPDVFTSRLSFPCTGSISVWFRTDGQLQRNWLDR